MEVRPIDANRLAEEIAHMSEAGHRTWSTKGLLDLLCRQPTLARQHEPLTLISMEDDLPPDNERVLVYRPCMADADIGPYSVQWGWAAKKDGSYWASLTLQPNEPLTLDELRGMDGEPAWWDAGKGSCWGIICVDSSGIFAGIPFFRGRWRGSNFEYDIEARGMTLYRRPPEGAAGNAKLKCKHWQWRGRKEGKMKRLTDRRFAQDGFFFSTDLEERKEVQFMAKPTYKQLYDRLAAYEDTGLEPEDLKKAFNEDAVLKLAGQALGVEPDRLREMAQADRVGRCVVLPCKFGDTTFVVENNAISNGRVRKKYCPNCGARMDKED